MTTSEVGMLLQAMYISRAVRFAQLHYVDLLAVCRVNGLVILIFRQDGTLQLPWIEIGGRGK